MNTKAFFETILMLIPISFCVFVIYDFIFSNSPARKLTLWNFLSRNMSDTGERDTSAFIIAVFMLIVLSIALIRNIFF